MGPGKTDLLTLPCGKCLGCKYDHARDWETRIINEASLYLCNSFVTLTYDNDHLPIGQTLIPEHVTLFLKKLRKKTRDPIRYYYSGEYGDQLDRPHYHLILFNYWPKDATFLKKTKLGDKLFSSESLEKTWGKGFAPIGTVTAQSAGYVARYVMKKIKGKDAHEKYWKFDPRTGLDHELHPEFARMSRGARCEDHKELPQRPLDCFRCTGGIGYGYIQRYHRDIYGPHQSREITDEVVVNEKPRKPPRAYDKFILERRGEQFLERLKHQRYTSSLEHWDEQQPARLLVKEKVREGRLKSLRRDYESGLSE